MIKLLRAVAFSVCLLGPIFSVAQADELTTPSSSKATAMSALVAQLIRGKPSAPHSPIIKGANILESACGGLTAPAWIVQEASVCDNIR
jgi:hypothetical protein